MKRKTVVFVCCALIFIICALSGCRLAREDAEYGAYEDRLVGIFVTTEHLDLFDFEGYLSDNLRGFQGGEITMDGNTQKYQGRVYAELVRRTLTSEERGETLEMEEYVFEGLEGISYFAPTITDESGSYTATTSDEAISDGYMHVYAGDEERIELEGTLYVLPGGEHTYYLNPVYQSADGSVYVTAGGSISSTINADSEGALMSQWLEASYTVTENGKTKTESISVTLSISMMFAPEKIVVLQMGADSGIISRTEYAPGEMPEAIVPESETDYLIVETYKRSAGNAKVSREIFGKDPESIETYSVRADGICIKHGTQIKWE